KDAAVTTAKLDADAVTNEKLADNAVQTENIKDGSVTASKIDSSVAGAGLTQDANGALKVDVSAITGDGSITSTDLEVNGGTNSTFEDVTLEIKAGAVTTAKLDADAVTNEKLADNAVETENIKDGSVTTDKILNGTIATEDIASTGDNKVLTTADDGTVTWIDKTELAIEPWNKENSTDKATSNGSNIYQTGSIGIGDFSSAAVSEKLDVKDGNVKIRDINGVAGSVTDKVVVADSNGVLKTVSSMPGIRTETTDYLAVLADETILADAVTADVTVTLPDEPITGKKYYIKKIDTSDNKVTISGNGKTIEGLSSISGALPYQGWVLQYSGTGWFIISRI
ncbi:hypothetical protein NHE85_16625, partial [Flavobacterium sp. NRK1]|nr:hypothetical protein [Flavobacterium sp. NRK1]